MRTSPLSNLDLSDFSVSTGLEDFDEPMVIEGDVAVAEAIQDLRRSQAEISVIGEVREYLTENRTSMNEAKAIELRAKVVDAVTAGQLRINPASVLADDISYNSSGSVQFVDAGLESIPGMIMKGIKWLIDLVIKSYKFIRQLMNSARVRLSKYRQRQDTITGFVSKGSKSAGPGYNLANGTVLTLDVESKGVLTCVARHAEHEGNEVTSESIRAGLTYLALDMKRLEKWIINGFIALSKKVCSNIASDRGVNSQEYISFPDNTFWMDTVADKSTRRIVGAATRNYSNEGRFVIRGDIDQLNEPNVTNLLSAVGGMTASVEMVPKENVNAITILSPSGWTDSGELVKALKRITDDAIDSDVDSKLSEMEKEILKSTKILSNKSTPDQSAYVTMMTAALTTCTMITMDAQRYRVNTVDRVCLAMDKYFQACIV